MRNTVNEWDIRWSQLLNTDCKQQAVADLYKTMSTPGSWEIIDLLVDFYKENWVLPQFDDFAETGIDEDLFQDVRKNLHGSTYLTHPDAKNVIKTSISQKIEPLLPKND
jgi:hypothetical protein